ncbi:hypothetical protein [Actinomadura sp. SCN-SB]|uniref:hypothetical protein n=1 Tax=Actinomadura sp. SCN-SB TaxID=3373092 RepID=UPI003750BDCF
MGRLRREMREVARARGIELPADENMKTQVSRWANGHTAPSLFYAELIGAVFGVRFLPGKPGAPVPAIPPPPVPPGTGEVDLAEIRRRLDAMAAEITALSSILADTVHGARERSAGVHGPAGERSPISPDVQRRPRPVHGDVQDAVHRRGVR